MYKNKIGIIIPYWGEWPAWFYYYLVSCKYNPEINWLFFSDCGPLPLQITNANLIEMTLQKFNSLASEKLHLSVSIKHPYKLCDFKPAYGKIFEDYISDYDFWGYGDIDLIYGDIKYFITNEILDNSDIITFHKTFLPGHLCLLRNNSFVNQLFKKSDLWRFVFTNEKMYSFSEKFSKKGISIKPENLENETQVKINKHLFKSKIFMSPIIKKIKQTGLVENFTSKKLWETKLKDFNEIVSYHEDIKSLTVYREALYRDDIMYLQERKNHWEIHWNNGKLYEREREIIYFHFQLAKFRNQIKFNDEIEKKNAFGIEKG